MNFQILPLKFFFFFIFNFKILFFFMSISLRIYLFYLFSFRLARSLNSHICTLNIGKMPYSHANCDAENFEFYGSFVKRLSHHCTVAEQFSVCTQCGSLVWGLILQTVFCAFCLMFLWELKFFWDWIRSFFKFNKIFKGKTLFKFI